MAQTKGYRIYRLNDRGRIIAAPTIIQAADDRDAMQQAAAELAGLSGELWLDAKLIAAYHPFSLDAFPIEGTFGQKGPSSLMINAG